MSAGSRCPPRPAPPPLSIQDCIHAACLEEDIRILPNGVETEIGERGLTLSGGQKQRVSLARALYCDKRMYLLDDPLSAVDAEVGRRIFDRAIRGLLKGKTVLFVTHQLQYLPHCDRVLFIEQGKVAEAGAHSSLVAQGGGYARLYASHSDNQTSIQQGESTGEAGEGAPTTGANTAGADAGPGPGAHDAATSSTAAAEPDATPSTEAKKGQLVAQEEKLTGSVTLRTYWHYCKAAGGALPVLLLLLLFIMAAAAKIFSDVFLTQWLEIADRKYNSNLSADPNVHLYALIYGLSAVGVLVIQAVRALFYTNRTLTAASVLHKKVRGRGEGERENRGREEDESDGE